MIGGEALASYQSLYLTSVTRKAAPISVEKLLD